MTTVSTPKLRAHPAYLAVIRTIDKFTVVTSYLFVIAIVPLIFANVVEVFARYVLRAPTVWALDVTTMSYATLFMLGAALALLKGAHVRTDMLWERFSDRTKGMIDSLALLVFFLPTMAVLFFISWDDFLYSISIDERSSSGAWAVAGVGVVYAPATKARTPTRIASAIADFTDTSLRIWPSAVRGSQCRKVARF